MFSKGKPLGSFLPNQQKIKAEHSSSISNRSFQSASSLSTKSNQAGGSQLRQTKLYINQKDKKLKYDGFVEEIVPKVKAKYDFTYVPPPKSLNKTFGGVVATGTGAALPDDPLAQKPGRNLISLVGRVDYSMKTHKMHPDLNIIWSIYGKLLRIIVGKRFEHTLLVRNDEPGPILQAIYYDFDEDLRHLKNGCFVHLVGRFKTENRLQTFRVNQVSPEEWHNNFMRIENVTSFILMQNNVQK
ncbi:uncharacterized protein [Drosophila tropicalis]|uniref:uncharacterized protein n=1 Tax=Drosophila tropicalis TaxID=46794 RepID=UPI0035AB7E3C